MKVTLPQLTRLSLGSWLPALGVLPLGSGDMLGIIGYTDVALADDDENPE